MSESNYHDDLDRAQCEAALKALEQVLRFVPAAGRSAVQDALSFSSVCFSAGGESQTCRLFFFPADVLFGLEPGMQVLICFARKDGEDEHHVYGLFTGQNRHLVVASTSLEVYYQIADLKGREPDYEAVMRLGEPAFAEPVMAIEVFA